MAKLDYQKSKVYKSDDVFINKIKTNRFGSDAHIANLAIKCFDKMILDPKNKLTNPEDLWVKSLKWAKSKLN